MGSIRKIAFDFCKNICGCVLFGLGFSVFLEPNGLNAGGLTGLSMALVHLLGIGTVGSLTILMNLPLFFLGSLKLGKRFLVGSLLGLVFASVFIDLFAALPYPQTEPLIGALYGGALCGGGLGLVFLSGSSTGGSDIIVRLLKLRYHNVPIGIIGMCFDLCVVVLTGIVFRDVTRTLYSGVTIFLTGRIVDAVVYRFDYSKVALIISKQYESVVLVIAQELDRGATLLHGEGAYSHESCKVVLTAVKRQQLADLKRLVSEVDPQAFVIVQEAHQVLGDGFSRYSKDAL